MARRRKKIKTRKQQAKQQRRAAMARKRKKTGGKPRQARSKRDQDDVFEDMLPLFPLVADTSASPADGVEQLMMTLLASEDLIEKPEFDEIIIDPLRCVDTLIEVGEKLGVDPAALGQLPDEEREETQMQMLEMTTQQLLTDQLCQDILNALHRLRLRLKRAGERKELARAAALQSFLSGSESPEIWPMIGLVQAIVQRSLAAGFELYAASMEVSEAGDLDESNTPLTLSEKLAKSGAAQRTEAVLQRVPGLSGFLEKQADSIWEEGTQAVLMGDLHLGLFTAEELETGLDIFSSTLGDDVGQETAAHEPTERAITEEQGKTLISHIDNYVIELFTPARLEQTRSRLNAFLNSSDCPKKWLAFLMMLVTQLADEEVVENEKGFLIAAFLGEMRSANAALA